MRQHSIRGTGWNYSSYNAAYEEKLNYDANGNIKTLVRKGANIADRPLAMDNLKYFYYYTNTSDARAEYDPTATLPGDVKSLSNQLAHVNDTDPDANYTEDIDNQSAGNYDYDNIGNLIKDTKEGITGIDWTVYGKIRQIKKGSTTINYAYDAGGNRVTKEVITVPGPVNKQFYIRDAQGNTMAIYNSKSTYVDWAEQHLYGSSRLGIWNYGKAVPAAPAAIVYDSMMVGSVTYELTNHLGNVLSTISDKKVGISAAKTTVDYYDAEVLNQDDYYSGGMLMTGIPAKESIPVATPEAPDSLMIEDHYDTGVGGWSVYNWCEIVNDNGRVKVSANQAWGTPMKQLNLEKGKRYRIRFTIDMGNCGDLHIPVYNAANQTYEVMPEIGISVKTSGTYQGTFTASADEMFFLFEMIPGANPPPDSTGYYWIDNFSLEEITPPYGLTSRNYWTIVKPDDGRIKVSSTGIWGEAHRILKITTGKQYRLRYNLDLGNCTFLHVIVSNPADGSYTFPAETGLGITQSGNYAGTFTAAGDSLELRFQMPAMPVGADTGYFWLNDVWVDEVIPYDGGGSGSSGSDNGYRYAFNGKELDRETPVQYDYGFRIYDPRLVRFKSVDPLTKSYPWYTPYQFAGNKPIWAIDLDGLEELVYQYTLENGKATLLKKINNAEIKMEGVTMRTQKPVIYDKRTGEPMAASEIGKVQYQYFDADEDRMYKRRNIDGEYVGGKNELMDIGANNLFGSIYIGPNNPTVIDAKTGKERADYRREPQDAVDAAAMQHDQKYDATKAAGGTDAFFNRDVRGADIDLVNSANQTAKGGIDNVTGKPVSRRTKSRAKMVSSFFSWILNHTKPETPRPKVNTSDNPGARITEPKY